MARQPMKVLCGSLVCLLVYGCAPSLIRMNQGEWNDIKAQPEIPAVHYQPARFAVITPETVAADMFGAVGVLVGAAYLDKSEQMVKEFGLEDPILQVKSRFLSLAKQDAVISTISSIQESLSDDDEAVLQRKLGKSLALDFKTVRWMLRYYYWPHNSQYQLIYSARSRLIRLNEAKTIWQGVCYFEEERSPQSPTLQELTADNASLLKTKIKEMAERCAKQLLTQLMGQE